jgi:hypothetical protein
VRLEGVSGEISGEISGEVSDKRSWGFSERSSSWSGRASVPKEAGTQTELRHEARRFPRRPSDSSSRFIAHVESLHLS